jgi:hypothetical protein
MRQALALLALAPVPALAQQAALPFDAPQIQLPIDSPPFQRLLDFDGDGDLDAVGSRPRLPSGDGDRIDGCEFAFWQNDGSGRFVELQREFLLMPARKAPRPVLPLAVGDWSGDGVADFVLATGFELQRFRSTPGAALPFERTVVPFPEAIQDVVVADLDGDGLQDIALLVGDAPTYFGEAQESLVRVLWSGRKVRTVGPTQVRLEWSSKLQLLEGDGDGLPDLLATHGYRASVLVLRERELERGLEFDFASYDGHVTTGDIDGDGDEDIVSFAAGPQVQVARRTGPASWQLEPRYAGGPAEYLADIDGDGDPDGVCCSGGGGSSSFPELGFHSTFEIALNQEGVFARAFEMPGLGSRSMAGAADVDGDGDIDLIAGRCVYFQSAPWGSLTRPALGISAARELFDVDGDGDEDPWQTAGTGAAFSGLRNAGDGSFAWQTMQMEEPDAGFAVTGVRLPGDFDADGDVDVIQGVRPASTPYVGPSFLGLWLNRGGGDFAYAGTCLLPDASAPYPLPGGAVTNFVLADLEQDGDLDFVYVPGRYRSQTYLNDGLGHFELDTVLVDPNEGASAFADFDGDGRLDKLVYDGVSPIYWRRGLPAGSATLFGEYESLFWGPTGSPDTYELADFDQDGALDLAAVMSGGPRIWLNRLGAGSGFVETRPFVTDVLRPETRVHALDVDQDGRMDLLFGPTDTAARPFRYYRQRADAGPDLGVSAYEPPLDLVLPGIERYVNFGGPVEVALLASDLDGDGDPDLVGDYGMKNRTFEGASAGARLQYGSATAGSGGLLPTLGAVGPFCAGGRLEFRLTGASATSAWLALSFAAADRLEQGVRVWIDTSPAAGFHAQLLALSGTGTGSAQASLELPIALDWIGQDLHAQAFAADPGGPLGWSATQGLRLTLGASR